MYRKILGKDLTRRKGINGILFLFILLSTIFLASSINNILVVSSGVDYFLDISKTPDITWIMVGEDEKEQVVTWLDSRNDITYEFAPLVIMQERDLYIKEEETQIVCDNLSLYLGSFDGFYAKVFDENNEEIQLNQGEIVVTQNVAKSNDLVPGDKIFLQVEGEIGRASCRERVPSPV